MRATITPCTPRVRLLGGREPCPCLGRACCAAATGCAASQPRCISCCVREGNPHPHPHPYTPPRADAGGCCDCGDESSWRPAGCCPRHRQARWNTTALLCRKAVIEYGSLYEERNFKYWRSLAKIYSSYDAAQPAKTFHAPLSWDRAACSCRLRLEGPACPTMPCRPPGAGTAAPPGLPPGDAAIMRGIAGCALVRLQLALEGGWAVGRQGAALLGAARSVMGRHLLYTFLAAAQPA